MAERGYQNLNTSVLRQILKAFKHDPAANIEPVLNKVYSFDPKLRKNIASNDARAEGAKDGLALLSWCIDTYATFIQSQLPPSEQTENPTHLHECQSDISTVRELVFAGTTLFESFKLRAVVQITENIVIKITQSLEHDKHGVLQFLEVHIPSVALFTPHPLGLIRHQQNGSLWYLAKYGNGPVGQGNQDYDNFLVLLSPI
ncbi:hypothetical protein C0995_004742 [Termitomyces sp. Mi166|nr:hypothetical protein C0995_004742 [Termitomyces sp. Mi166\